MRSHMSKSFVNCQTHMNINCYCWIIYKWNLKYFKCVRVAYHACPHHASHWSAPNFEKALMGRPRSHAFKIASSKQGQAVKKESSSHSCLLWLQPAMGREGKLHTHPQDIIQPSKQNKVSQFPSILLVKHMTKSRKWLPHHDLWRLGSSIYRAEAPPAENPSPICLAPLFPRPHRKHFRTTNTLKFITHDNLKGDQELKQKFIKIHL